MASQGGLQRRVQDVVLVAVAVGVAVVALRARRRRRLLQTHQHVHLSAENTSVSLMELYHSEMEEAFVPLKVHLLAFYLCRKLKTVSGP